MIVLTRCAYARAGKNGSSPPAKHLHARAYDKPGHDGPVPYPCVTSEHSPAASATAYTLAMTAMTEDARGRFAQPSKFTCWIDPATRAKIYAARHQSLLMGRIRGLTLRVTPRFRLELSRGWTLGVR